MKRLPIRKIREALRLRAEGLSGRRVAQSLSLGRATVSEYFRRADVAGLAWPLPDGLSDIDLEHRLYPHEPGASDRDTPQPDWAYVHSELRGKGVTLALLWEEYRSVHPDGYGYSRYCELYTRWEGRLSPVMRQRHPAGERLFVDYAGHTADVVCPETGDVRRAQIFVAALGASNFTYVKDLLAARGIIVSYESIRKWVGKFGTKYAASIRRDRPAPSDKWHLDEAVIPIRGRKIWLWRAIDSNGDVLDILVQSRRNTRATKRFFRKLFKLYGRPRVVITDKLSSCSAALKSLAPSIDHRWHKRSKTDLMARIDRRCVEKRSWPASNRLGKHNCFCLSTIKSKPYFALAATNWLPLPIDNPAQMLTAFGTTSRVSRRSLDQVCEALFRQEPIS